ncbi:MAG: GNAT family N-acetyltransferase, partial [Ignavibacteriae bacterium]|nr:GNAT family N-acetyltransferase [Ignavibacteriota bacterium]
YGGLVHINLVDRNTEISFIMDTAKENDEFHFHWNLFLELIEKVAFDELNLHKLYTFAFDLRPHLYQALESAGYNREAILSEHCFFDDKFKDVVIHSKIKRRMTIRTAIEDDLVLFYKWANEETTRSMSFNEAPITLDEHTKWFKEQLRSREDILLVFEVDNIPAGNVRFNREGVIGISLDKAFRSKNLGVILIKEGIKFIQSNTELKEITAFIKKENIPSIRVFEKTGFIFAADAVIKKKECFRYIYKLN